jgi:hypothetical protein
MDTSDEPRPPAPWTRTAAADDSIAYERTGESSTGRCTVRLVASRTSEAHPPGNGGRGWTVRLECQQGSCPVRRATTRVSARPEAVRVLFSAMRAVNEALAGGEDDTVTPGTLVARFRARVDSRSRG